MQFESTFARIDKMRGALRAEYGPDAESAITAIIETSNFNSKRIRF